MANTRFREILKRATIILVIAGLVLIMGPLFVIWLSATDEIDELIRRELPTGSSKLKVYDFLDSRVISSSGYQVEPDPLDSCPSEDEQKKRYVTASIPVRSGLPFRPDSVKIVFYFDEEGRLIEYKLREHYDVP